MNHPGVRYLACAIYSKCERKPNGQSRIDNPDTHTTLGTKILVVNTNEQKSRHFLMDQYRPLSRGPQAWGPQHICQFTI